MKRFYLFALAAMVFAACATDDTQDLRPMDAPETLTVGFEGGDDDTRVQLNEAGKTVWTKGDLVSVFYRSDANQKWQFQGETGERLGNLKRVNAGSATETMQRVVVVYPYNENYYINTETYNIETTLPATQTYLKDSYGLDGNLMISSDEFNQISLKSVYGWLKLQLTGNGERVQSITLKGNNGEQVAGLVYINSSNAAMTLAADMGSADDPAVGGVGGNLIFDDTILTEVALNCGNGVELGAEATAFYIALPPQTFEKGLTVEIETTDGKTMTKSTDKSLVIERNTIQPMAAFKLEIEKPETPTLPTPANNEIWYTSSDGNVVTPFSTDVFGASIVSNTYDAEKECWVIKFDGEVTSIGDYAFNYCTSLTSVTIGNSVTSIGYMAFQECTSLTGVTITNSVTEIGYATFAYCSSLTSVTIPDSVTLIGEYAFYECTSLKSVTIGSGVTEIGEQAFYGCTSLPVIDDIRYADTYLVEVVDRTRTSYSIKPGTRIIGRDAFYECTSLTSITIPDSVTSIGGGAFQECTSLTSITIPDSVTSIEQEAFWGCYSLTSITIPDSVTSIGYGAFYNCQSLASVTIPNSVTSIGGRAFSNCTSLTSVTIPDSVTSIGGRAFSNCTSLTSVTIGNGVTLIGYSAFGQCTSLTSITIPDSVTSIGSSAFSGCSSLTSITIPDSVTEIGNYAFDSCTSLTSVTIPDSVTSIGGNAFAYCSSLTNITIPDSVTSIGDRAFFGCTSLKEVYCKPTTPPTGGWDMFSNNAYGRKIYVPASADDSIINAYKAAQYWSDYSADIEEYDFSAQQ